MAKSPRKSKGKKSVSPGRREENVTLRKPKANKGDPKAKEKWEKERAQIELEKALEAQKEINKLIKKSEKRSRSRLSF